MLTCCGPGRYSCAVIPEDPFMGSNASSLLTARPTRIHEVQALHARELGRMMAANMDHEPTCDDPDASPVEARARRFG